MQIPNHKSWVEISESALVHNMNVFKGIIEKSVKLAIPVKGNAYGHGIIECSKIYIKNGISIFCVDSLKEVEVMRASGINCTILILGYVPINQIKKALDLNSELTIYNKEIINEIGRLNKPANIHLKIETGTNRQGVAINEVKEFAKTIKSYSNITLKGVSTHFADIEDHMDKSYAKKQINNFQLAIDHLKEEGLKPKIKHCSNSAATLIMPESNLDMIRPGIGSYGLWPSKKTKQSVRRQEKKIKLKPVLSWKSLVAQVKMIKKGEPVSYGRTYTMPHDGKIAIIPVGYYEGIPRSLSRTNTKKKNIAEVLIQGKRAPIVGRVCMNIIMVDVTHISKVNNEDEVVIIGKQGKEEITAEEFAKRQGTINYEVTTQISERLPRIITK